MLITNTDRSKVFLGGNESITASYTNGTGSEIVLPMGRIFGRITASNKVGLQDKDNTDGSQHPRFVLMHNMTVANGATVELTLCNGGKVDPAKLICASGETLASVVSTTFTDSATNTVAIPFGTIGDLLMANSRIQLTPTIENTAYDNQP